MVLEETKVVAHVDYREPAGPQQFAYYYTRGPSASQWPEVEHGIIRPAIQEAQKRYSIKVDDFNWGELPQVEGRTIYVLAGPVNPLQLTQTEQEYLQTLSQTTGAKVNIISAFPYTLLGDQDKYLETAHIRIPAQDRALGINTIFPDLTEPYYGVRTVSQADIVDNMVCETFRTKYSPVRLVPADPRYEAAQVYLAEGQTHHTHTVEALRRLFAAYGLWHRDRTDGAIMLRAPNGKWLMSQTKTDKTAMTTSNFSLIAGYNPETNIIEFIGEKLPSSDTPEFLVVMDNLNGRWGNEALIAVHFHHNGITRGKGFEYRKTAAVIPYGEFNSGEEIVKFLESSLGNWLILREHGILWIGRSPEQFEDFVRNTLKLEKSI